MQEHPEGGTTGAFSSSEARTNPLIARIADQTIPYGLILLHSELKETTDLLAVSNYPAYAHRYTEAEFYDLLGRELQIIRASVPIITAELGYDHIGSTATLSPDEVKDALYIALTQYGSVFTFDGRAIGLDGNGGPVELLPLNVPNPRYDPSNPQPSEPELLNLRIENRIMGGRAEQVKVSPPSEGLPMHLVNFPRIVGSPQSSPLLQVYRYDAQDLGAAGRTRVFQNATGTVRGTMNAAATQAGRTIRGR